MILSIFFKIEEILDFSYIALKMILKFDIWYSYV